jgi:hypothetical protein
LDWPSLAFPYVNGTALFPAFTESVIALPYTEGEGELIVSTCLGINEIHSFPEINMPVIALNPHYGTMFKLPRVRTWMPGASALRLKGMWERKSKPPAQLVEQAGRRWGDVAARVARYGARKWSWPRFSNSISPPHSWAMLPLDKAGPRGAALRRVGGLQRASPRCGLGEAVQRLGPTAYCH